MSAFIKSAKVVYDVEMDFGYVEIRYLSCKESKVHYREYTDYLNTEAVGKWTELDFDNAAMGYEDFLSVMVRKTLEVRQRMASLMLDNILMDYQDDKALLELMNASKILDSSFTPPYLDMTSPWQRSFLKHFCEDVIYDIIDHCRNEYKLAKYFSVMKLLELKLSKRPQK